MAILSPRDTFLHAALVLAAYGWEVFPLWPRGKTPRIPNAHPEGDPLRGKCHGEICGRHGHGMHDSTTDFATITAWWRKYPGANVGVRVPPNVFVLDVDPRHGGLESLVKLQTTYEPLPTTMMMFSGRGDGGHHYFYRRPPGKLAASRLGRH